MQINIGGRIDGLTEDNQLIEMKNRQFRIFPQVPIYEKVQLHVYMYLLDKDDCQLIQNCSRTSEMKVDDISFDAEFWVIFFKK